MDRTPMRYYRWLHVGEAIEGTEWQPWVVELQLSLDSEYALQAGTSVAAEGLAFTGICDVGKATDFPFTIPQLPVASQRLLSIIRGAGRQWTEFLPLGLAYPDGKPGPTGYAVVNILQTIDCLHRKYSDYEAYTTQNLTTWERQPHLLGQFRQVRDLVLDQRQLRDHPIFRVWGWSSTIVVRADLKRAMDDEGITGCIFEELKVAKD
jgi:hypothetical protein